MPEQGVSNCESAMDFISNPVSGWHQRNGRGSQNQSSRGVEGPPSAYRPQGVDWVKHGRGNPVYHTYKDYKDYIVFWQVLY